MYSVSLCAVLQPLAAHAHPRLFLRLESTERCQVCKWAPGRLSLQTHLWARRSWFFLVRGDSRIGEGCCRLHPLCPTRSLTRLAVVLLSYCGGILCVVENACDSKSFSGNTHAALLNRFGQKKFLAGNQTFSEVFAVTRGVYRKACDSPNVDRRLFFVPPTTALCCIDPRFASFPQTAR